jgi:tRNA modification GTPase
VGYDAAIVTDIEGTTRDVLRQVSSLGDVTLTLADTAGLRETSDRVESIGVERALRELESAELILAVFDGSCALSDDDMDVIRHLDGASCPCIALVNKSDIGVDAHTARVLSEHFEHTVSICASSGQGFDSLAQKVRELFMDGSIDIDNDAIVCGARQFSSLSLAKASLSSALDELCADTPLDLCCIAIESALSCLGELDGRELGEQIVSEIFSKFCVGK